jgi:hypothetical protein
MKSRSGALVIAGWLALGVFVVGDARAQSACGFSLGSGIYAKWVATGGESGFLGCPTGNEAEAARSPQGTGGRYAEFRGGDGGVIVWHGSGRLQSRSFEVHGCIYKVYRSLGSSASWLGFPTSDEYDASGGRRSDFEGGAIVWDARTRECRAVRGDKSDGGVGDCSSVEGSWRWFNGKTVVLQSGGVLECEDDKGSWTLTDAPGRRYLLNWGSGWVDDLRLSADGRSLDGTNQEGTQVSGGRECRGGGGGGAAGGGGGVGGGVGGGGGSGGGVGVGGSADECARAEGAWRWFNGKTVVLQSGGRLECEDDQGSWRLVDPGQRRYVLNWGAGWVDDLQLSVDGRRLDGTNQTGGQVSGSRDCRGSGGGGVGGSGGGGICADPRTLAIMDEWLARAIPPQKPGESLRYEAWGRLVGRSLTATLTTSGKPDTQLSRCEWLWAHASRLLSTNGLGSLQEYVEQRLRPPRERPTKK